MPETSTKMMENRLGKANPESRQPGPWSRKKHTPPGLGPRCLAKASELICCPKVYNRAVNTYHCGLGMELSAHSACLPRTKPCC